MDPDKARRARRNTVPVLMLAAECMLGAVIALTSQGEQLTPSHDGDDAWAIAIGIVAAIVCFFGMIRIRPLGMRGTLAVIMCPLLVGFMAWPMASIALMRLHQIVDFAGGPASVSEHQLSAVTAEIIHGRGVNYSVWLRHYVASLDIDEGDYRAAFGDAEHADAKGFCVWVTVKTKGAASMIVTDHWDLPPGSVVRCGQKRGTTTIDSRPPEVRRMWATAIGGAG